MKKSEEGTKELRFVLQHARISRDFLKWNDSMIMNTTNVGEGRSQGLGDFR